MPSRIGFEQQHQIGRLGSDEIERRTVITVRLEHVEDEEADAVVRTTRPCSLCLRRRQSRERQDIAGLQGKSRDHGDRQSQRRVVPGDREKPDTVRSERDRDLQPGKIQAADDAKVRRNQG